MGGEELIATLADREVVRSVLERTGLLELAEVYAYPDARTDGVRTPWLRANMVATADGAASLNGLTQGISSDTDRRVFALLRALCDVILVGASTVRKERA